MERCLPEPPLSQLDIAQAVNVIAKALRSKTWREHVIRSCRGCSRACGRASLHSHQDVELFRARATADGIMPRTVCDYLIMKFLNHVGWVLTLEIPQLASLLYDAFVTLQPRPSKVEKPPTLDKVKAVFRAAEKV